MDTIPVFNILAIAAFGLLLAVTGGIGYLTLVEWRDRRRRDRENKELRRSSKAKKRGARN
ncbi:MAG: hypothetical protein ACRCZS_14825 [Chroococcidiopsis sp.]